MFETEERPDDPDAPATGAPDEPVQEPPPAGEDLEDPGEGGADPEQI